MKKILFIIKNKNEASSRFRVLAYFNKLENDFYPDVFYAEYHNTHISKVFRSLIKRIRYLYLLLRIKRYDIIYMQRPMSSGHSKNNSFEKLLTIINPNLIFDFDDALFIEHKKKIISLINLSKVCVCGNKYLASFTRQYNQNIFIIPTSIDTDKFTPKPNNSNNTLTIGWTGTSGNYQFFTEKMIAEINAILKTYRHVRFLFICDHQPDNRFIFPYDFIYWNDKTEVNDLINIDIGLMPLIDSAWSRGKCGFKLIQYGAIGIASIASDVGVNSDVILNGESGILVKNDSWTVALTTLIENSSLRKKMGTHARKHIQKNYSLKTNYKKLSQVIHSLLN